MVFDGALSVTQIQGFQGHSHTRSTLEYSQARALLSQKGVSIPKRRECKQDFNDLIDNS
jgi:hypothetical protein